MITRTILPCILASLTWTIVSLTLYQAKQGNVANTTRQPIGRLPASFGHSTIDRQACLCIPRIPKTGSQSFDAMLRGMATPIARNCTISSHFLLNSPEGGEAIAMDPSLARGPGVVRHGRERQRDLGKGEVGDRSGYSRCPWRMDGGQAVVRALTVREPSDHLRSLCHFWRAGDSYLFPGGRDDSPRRNCTEAQLAYPALFDNPQCRYVLGVTSASEMRVTWARLSASMRRAWLVDALAGTHAVVPLDRLSDGLLLLAHALGYDAPPPTLPHLEHAGDLVRDAAAHDAATTVQDRHLYEPQCDTQLYMLARSLQDQRVRTELPPSWANLRYTCTVQRSCAGPAAKKCAGTCTLADTSLVDGTT